MPQAYGDGRIADSLRHVAAPGDNATYNPPYVYSAQCAECHAMTLASAHASATAGAFACVFLVSPQPAQHGESVEQDVLQGGCHPVGTSTEQHADIATVHNAANATETAAGCTLSWYESGVRRTACHYTDLVQEHNRTRQNSSPYPYPASSAIRARDLQVSDGRGTDRALNVTQTATLSLGLLAPMQSAPNTLTQRPVQRRQRFSRRSNTTGRARLDPTTGRVQQHPVP